MAFKIPTTLLAKGVDPFPCLESLWSLYSKKGKRTVFITLGASKSCLSDLEIAEALGCTIHIAPASELQRAQWEEVKNVLVARKATGNSFSAGAEEKWIVPKNFNIIPFPQLWGSGPRNSEPIFDWVQTLCFGIGLTETRIDILKIDLGNGDERAVLYAILDAGFRPSTLLVNWSEMPDTSVPLSLVAGHLQNMGYQLLATQERKFLYYFTDKDWYMTCSWEDTTCQNPLIAEVIKMIPKVRDANDCSRRLAPTGKTDSPAEHQKTEH